MGLRVPRSLKSVVPRCIAGATAAVGADERGQMIVPKPIAEFDVLGGLALRRRAGAFPRGLARRPTAA